MGSESQILELRLVDFMHRSEMLETELDVLCSKLRITSSIVPDEQNRDGTPLKESTLNATQQQVQASVRAYLQSQNEKFVETIYKKYAVDDASMIKADKLPTALNEFNIILTDEEAEAFMTSMDTDNNGGLDLQEFKRALIRPSTEVEQFVKTLPISGTLACCLATQGAAEPLKALCALSRDQLKGRMEAFMPIFLHNVLEPELDKLKELLKAREAEEAGGYGSKFAGFCMNAGLISHYYEGPYKRIGRHALTLEIPRSSSRKTKHGKPADQPTEPLFVFYVPPRVKGKWAGQRGGRLSARKGLTKNWFSAQAHSTPRFRRASRTSTRTCTAATPSSPRAITG